MFPVPEIGYGWILALLASMAFFAKAADMEARSRFVWAGLSLGSWLVCTSWFVGGIVGGLLSQVLLFLALTGWAFAREWLANRRGG